MEVKEKTDTAVKDIIIINNDRSQGYKTAAQETKDADLKALFNRLSDQSKGFADELKTFVSDATKLPKPEETKASGKLFRVWMDVKSAITANNRKAILSSCEFGEDQAKKTYDDVLKDSGEISNQVVDVVKKQREQIQRSHDEVKNLRDSTK